MKITKKIVSMMVVAVMAIGVLFVGAQLTQADAKTKAKNGSTVVLYFSGSGNTRTIAKKVQKATKGKLIQIKAKDPYTDADLDYSQESSRVVKEHESNGGDGKTPLDSTVRPQISNISAIKKAVKNAKTVYIGYPIWWQEAPHIIYSLVENVNLGGKRVVPFNSSMASGSGQSSNHLLQDAKVNSKTVWLAGKGFTDAGPSQKSINKWVKGNARRKGQKLPSKTSGRKSNNDATTDNGSTSTDNAQKPATTTSKKLVVYFSGTGNTERVAKAVAADAGADTFVITPKDPYTNADLNFNNSDSRVVREYQDSSLQNVELTTTTVPDWDSYDTVFIGYPIWWGNAAWPVNGFVKANDFTGKTVIPFCTSFSSGIGSSGTNLQNMAGGNGNWQTGHRFAERATDSDVKAWVDSLGL